MRIARLAGCAAALIAVAVTGSARAQDVYHDNVVIILDSSGSMNETMCGTQVVKIDAAKRALAEVLEHIPSTTQVGLLVFGGSRSATDWLYPLGPRDDAKLAQAIAAPRPSGTTPLGAYMKKACDRLIEERGAQMGYGTYRLLVVTDGEATDKDLVELYTPEIVARGITVDVIGVDMAAAHTLATKVHSYRRANDAASLERAVADVFAEVSSGASQDAGVDAFELLAPIPASTAEAMIGALVRSGNEPIGSTGRSFATAPPGPDGTPGSPAQAAPPGGNWVWFIVALFVAVGAFVLKGLKAAQRDGF